MQAPERRRHLLCLDELPLEVSPAAWRRDVDVAENEPLLGVMVFQGGQKEDLAVALREELRGRLALALCGDCDGERHHHGVNQREAVRAPRCEVPDVDALEC